MIMKLKLLALAIVVAVGLIGGASAYAQSSCPRIEPVDVTSLLIAPPCDGCDITKAELAELQTLQQSRTAEMVKHASDDYTRTVERFLAGMTPSIMVDNVGAADQLFACTADMTEDTIAAAKTKFNRTRPYRLPGNDLHVLKTIKANDAPSYPSSHSAFGTVTGLILIEMAPELRKQISARIDDFGLSRLISGVHYRSDVYAGEVAGAAIAASLFADRDFRAELEKVEPDFRKAIGY
jgi:acid phosphatase (class A)